MAEKEDVRQQYQVRSQIPDVRIEVADNERLHVEFRIDDLVRKLIPDRAGPTSSCDGCHGCSGCSM